MYLFPTNLMYVPFQHVPVFRYQLSGISDFDGSYRFLIQLGSGVLLFKSGLSNLRPAGQFFVAREVKCFHVFPELMKSEHAILSFGSIQPQLFLI